MTDSVRRMVRKQLNIEPEQDEALKSLAAKRGVSESELAREAIDMLVRDTAARDAAADRSLRILEELFAEWDASPLDLGALPSGAYRFGLYDAD